MRYVDMTKFKPPRVGFTARPDMTGTTLALPSDASPSPASPDASTSPAPYRHGTSKATSIVYQYWCEPATEADAQLLRDQIRLAADYRRELALIENRSRVLWRARNPPIARSGTAGVASAPATTADAVRAEVRALRRDEERMIDVDAVLHPIDEDEDEGEDDEAKGIDRWRRRRRMIGQLVVLGMSRGAALLLVEEDMIRVAQDAARCAARATAVGRGLYWGTYQHAEDGVSASCRSTPVWEDVTTSYRRDVGCAAVHLQPPRKLTADDDWVRVGAGPVRHGSEIDKGGRVRPARHREVKLRVGTGEGRSPRWAVLHVLMHRDLPADCVVSWAVVKLRRVGSKSRWTLCVTVGGVPAIGRSAHRARASVEERRDLCAGVDIGWRKVDGGVRVAYWWGSDGRSGEVVIPERVLSADAKADSLRAIRDRIKNEIRDEIRAWVKSISVLTEAEVRAADEMIERDCRQRCEAYLVHHHPGHGHGVSIDRGEVMIPAYPGARPDEVVRAVEYRCARVGDDREARGCTVVARLATPSPWIVEATASIHQWLRTSRFVRLFSRWREDRISVRGAGDEAIFAKVAAWLKQDRHLWDWEAAMRERRQRQVGERIRVLAVTLARAYGRIGVEAPMVARMVKRPARGVGAGACAACAACGESARKCASCEAAERSRRLAATRVQHAAPAKTREEIERFGAAYGAVVVRCDPAYTTADCAHCGHRQGEATGRSGEDGGGGGDGAEDRSTLEIRCPACGTAEDQDLRASKNLCRIASAAVLGPDGKPLAMNKSASSASSKRSLGARRNRKSATADRSRA